MKSLLRTLLDDKDPFPWHKHLRWAGMQVLRSCYQKAEAQLWKFRGGYKCIDCGGVGTRFKRAQYTGYVNGKRMLLEHTGLEFPFGKTLCPHCLYNRIEAYWTHAIRIAPSKFGDPEYPCTEDMGECIPSKSDGIYKGTCHWYGPHDEVTEGIRTFRNKLAEQYLGGSVIIGGNWWNGHDACLKAIKVLLTESGASETGFVVNSTFSMRDDGVILMKRGLYSDGRILGDPQPVTEVVQRKKK